MGCSLWGCKESDTTEGLTLSLSPIPLGGCEDPMKVSSECAHLQTAWCRVSISY